MRAEGVRLRRIRGYPDSFRLACLWAPPGWWDAVFTAGMPQWCGHLPVEDRFTPIARLVTSGPDLCCARAGSGSNPYRGAKLKLRDQAICLISLRISQAFLPRLGRLDSDPEWIRTLDPASIPKRIGTGPRCVPNFRRATILPVASANATPSAGTYPSGARSVSRSRSFLCLNSTAMQPSDRS